jgi:Domain of unknown function (DUF6456)
MSARIKPHSVRGRQLEEVREKDPDGRIVLHHRIVDSLAQLMKAGAIDGQMHDAGRRFHRDFTIAQLDPLQAADLLRVPGCGREPELLDSHVAGRRRVHNALEALGGISSPAGSAVWHIVGLQRSIRGWSQHQGWGRRRVEPKEAKGILVAALGMLAKHYGYSETVRSSK